MTEPKRYDERGREIVEQLPHGAYVDYGTGTFWEPENPYFFYGEDCPLCSRTDEERTAYYEAKAQERG